MTALRKYAFLVMALAAVFGVSAIAYATTTTQVDAKVGSSKAGTKAKPKKNFLDITTLADDPDGKLAVADQAKVFLAKGFKFNGGVFKKCTKAQADNLR